MSVTLTPLRRIGDPNLDHNFVAIQRAWTQLQGGLEYIWPTSYPASKLPLHIDTDGTVTEETVGSAGIADGSIIASKLTENSLGLTSDIAFAANDYRTVGWSSGTITFANGTSYSIDAGNTGAMTASTLYYIYLDVDTSSTVLQVSTTFSDCVGDRKALMCVANSNGATDEEPFFVPRVGEVMIASGNISAKAIKAAQIDVASLSAIVADVGTLTAGIIQDAGANQQIVLSGSPTASIYIDLSATGSDPFIAHTALSLLADGTADFGGIVSADTFSATYIEVGTPAYVYLSGRTNEYYYLLITGGSLAKTAGGGSVYNMVQVNPTLVLSGATTHVRGAYFRNLVSDAGYVLTNSVGVFIDNLSLTGGGGVTNTYGLYIEGSNLGTALNYAIWTDDAADTSLGAKLLVDTIDERDSDVGVTIEGVVLKDNAIDLLTNSGYVTGNDAVWLIRIDDGSKVYGNFYMASDTMYIGGVVSGTGALTTIFRAGNNVDVAKLDGSGTFYVDIIGELTGAAGVTIDGVLLKDGGATLTGKLDVSADAAHNIKRSTATTSNLGGSTLRLSNADETVSTNHTAGLLIRFNSTAGQAYNAGKLFWQKEQDWTATASTRDSKVTLAVFQDGSMTTVLEVLGSTLAATFAGSVNIDGVARIGDVGHGAEFAGFSHEDTFATGTYALLQQSDGTTFINAATGKKIHFRINNGSVIEYTPGSPNVLHPSTSGGVALGSASVLWSNLYIGQIIVGAPTGGAKGSGTINVASGIYLNNSAYSNPDYVFEIEYLGAPIKEYTRQDGSYPGRMSLLDLKTFTRENYHLPGIVRHEGVDIFARADMVLEKLEEAYLYIFELEERITELERSTT